MATGGLTWATSRHATTRARDPQVHDHVLIANAVVMGDARGGWKGADTAFLRDHLHAATAVGRMAAAARAVELGYGIVADAGPSGRLGSWAIAGIPAEVCAVHSTRSAQITAAVGPDASYASRSVAARTTRDRKVDVPVADLLARWQADLVAVGHPAKVLSIQVEEAGQAYEPVVADLEALAAELLGPGGRLAREKTFTRGDVIIAAAPHLHGLPLSVLDQAVETVPAHNEAVTLPTVTGCREQVWAARCVLADEERIAELAERLSGEEGPKVGHEVALQAVAGLEERLGGSLTETQRQVAVGLMTSGHRLEALIGIAGSGKTTTLAAVRAGFESAGYTVIGTATSGQAAKNLANGAGIDSRTIASLSWHLDHGTLALSDRHVLVVDEGAMTADVDLARLLTAVERARAKLVVAGDDRQLGAIGPGGALTALAEGHPEHLWTLTDNLRQTDPAEASALAQLRDGSIAAAVSWYARNGRIHPAADRRHALAAMIRAWASDVDAGRDTLMLAYRRESVEALNQAARGLFERAGRLTGPELTAPGGRRYRAGDRVITFAPGPNGAWVTSETARVTAVNPEAQTITAVTPDGRTLHMGSDDIGAERLGYSNAITAHRSQGATVDVAHVLDDGGGRELAYVAMSRAREESHIHVTAGDLADAAQRVAWSWDDERRQQWVRDRAGAAGHLEALRAERQQLVSTIPPRVDDQLAQLCAQQAALKQDLTDLQTGTGRWSETPVRVSHEDLQRAQWVHDENLCRAQNPRQGIRARRRNRQSLDTSAAALEEAHNAWRQLTQPHADHLAREQSLLAGQAKELEAAQRVRANFIATHPELMDRINELNRAVDTQQASERRRPAGRGVPQRHIYPQSATAGHGLSQPALPAGPEI